MSPSGTDATNLLTGIATIIPQLNYYQNTIPAYEYSAKPLPSALTITSIASYWYNPQFFTRYDEGTDNVLTSITQDLKINLANPQADSSSTLLQVNDTFTVDFPEYGNPKNACGLMGVAELHLLTCTGSASQTFGIIESEVYSSSVMTSGNLQIVPATATIAPGSSTSFTASTGSGIVWSLLEGQNAGSITPAVGNSVTYQAPANYTHSTETFHLIAINSQDASQYAEVPVQVTSSVSKTSTTTVLGSSSVLVPVGANLTINATVQASGGTPTGKVTFYDGGKVLTAALLNNAGVATYNSSSLTLGAHSITAQYGGDNNFSASTTLAAVTITVVAINPQLSVSPNSGIPNVTAFVKTDTGFTPYGLITHTATLPDKSVSVL
jgi:hypothetical protein